MNLSILGISDAVNGYFMSTHPPILFHSSFSHLFILDILSHTLPCHLNDDSMQPTPPHFDWLKTAYKILYLEIDLTVYISPVCSGLSFMHMLSK